MNELEIKHEEVLKNEREKKRPLNKAEIMKEMRKIMINTSQIKKYRDNRVRTAKYNA